MKTSMGLREWLLLLLLSILWGGSFFFNELALTSFRTLTVVLGRTSLAAIALWLIVYATGKKMPRSPQLWWAFFIMGFINNLIPFSFIVWGQTQIDSGLAAILNATTPLFSVFLVYFLSKEETLTAGRVIGVLIGLTGVMVLIGFDALRSLSLQALGQLAILGASCSYAFAAIFGRRFKGMPAMIPAAGMLTATSVMMLPLALFIDKPWTITPSLTAISAVVGIALLSTALAYLIYFHILAVAGATNVLLVTFLIPVSALLLGVLGLGERLEPSIFLGMGLIFAGLAAVDGRILKTFHKRLAEHL